MQSHRQQQRAEQLLTLAMLYGKEEIKPMGSVHC